MRRKFSNWFMGLSRGAKIFLGLGVITVLAIAGGGDSSKTEDTNASNTAQVSEQSAPKAPQITTKEELVEESIPYQKQSRQTDSLNKGETRIAQLGQNGVFTKTYKITLTDGLESKRELLKEEVTQNSIAEITEIGTFVKPATTRNSNCDSNYSGCVPVAIDVDCGGGSGDGPAYVYGPIQVIGHDIHGLDRDGDGIACDA